MNPLTICISPVTVKVLLRYLIARLIATINVAGCTIYSSIDKVRRKLYLGEILTLIVYAQLIPECRMFFDVEESRIYHEGSL